MCDVSGNQALKGQTKGRISTKCVERRNNFLGIVDIQVKHRFKCP